MSHLHAWYFGKRDEEEDEEPFKKPKSHPVDKEALARWVDSRLKAQHLRRTNETHAEAFERCMTHISFDDFCQALARSTRVLFQNLKNKPYVVDNCPRKNNGSGSLRSSKWVFEIVKHMGFLEYDPIKVFSGDNRYITQKEIGDCCIVYFDDMAYTGQQLAYRNVYYVDMEIYTTVFSVVPFLGVSSLDLFAYLPEYVTIKDTSLKPKIRATFACTNHPTRFSFREGFRLPRSNAYTTSLLEYEDWKDAIVPPMKPTVEQTFEFVYCFDTLVDHYRHCLDVDSERNAVDRPIRGYRDTPFYNKPRIMLDSSDLDGKDKKYAIYFDHKLADWLSTPEELMKGNTFAYPDDDMHSEYIPFIQGCTVPNRTCPEVPYY